MRPCFPFRRGYGCKQSVVTADHCITIPCFMNIFVAGTVLREKLERSIFRNLKRLYPEIEKAAAAAGHTVQLPLPDFELDHMPRTQFAREIQRRIRAADSLITVLYPPNDAVA